MTPEAAVRLWRDRPVSVLRGHEAGCCRAARAWVRAMELSRASGGSGPLWITDRYPWGPSAWPLHWCEAVRSRQLDCGALASLAREAFSARGRVGLPAQLVLGVPKGTTSHWAARWEAAGCRTDWIVGDLAYHEACAVLEGTGVRVWDPSRGAWLDPGGTGQVRVVAVRIAPAGRSPVPGGLRWGTVRIGPGAWQVLGKHWAARQKGRGRGVPVSAGQ
jgi:hypothetical protein